LKPNAGAAVDVTVDCPKPNEGAAEEATADPANPKGAGVGVVVAPPKPNEGADVVVPDWPNEKDDAPKAGGADVAGVAKANELNPAEENKKATVSHHVQSI